MFGWWMTRLSGQTDENWWRFMRGGCFYFAQRGTHNQKIKRAEADAAVQPQRTNTTNQHQFNAGWAPNDIRRPLRWLTWLTWLKHGWWWTLVQFLDWPLGRGPKMQLNSILLHLEVEQRQLYLRLVASCLSYRKAEVNVSFLITIFSHLQRNVTL